MLKTNEYIKEKTNKLVDAFFKLYEEMLKNEGKEVKHVSKFQELDIDDDYKIRVDWVWNWEIVYKESQAVIGEVQMIGVYALTRLIGVFTESIIGDHYMNEM